MTDITRRDFLKETVAAAAAVSLAGNIAGRTSMKTLGNENRSWETHPWERHGRLRVSKNGHFFEFEDGTGFFWLGDTAWLLGRLTPEDLGRYLRHRAALGFNVIQTIATLWSMPNYAGERVFEGGGPPYDRPKFNPKFWQHIDYIVAKAKEYGLFVALVPFWGRNVDNPFHDAPYNTGIHGQFFTDPDRDNYEFGKALGARYRDEPHILWIVSGEYHTPHNDTAFDRPVPEVHFRRLRALARGLREGSGGQQLMTIHPLSFFSSSDDFHEEAWLDFNMVQSHSAPELIGSLIGGDWALSPAKPTVNGEAGYDGYFEEGRQVDRHFLPFSTAWSQRYQAYWSVFLGGAGFTYGHRNLWSTAIHDHTHQELFTEWESYPGTLQEEALEAPGAATLKHLRVLIESKPIQSRIPDSSLLSVSSRGSDSSDLWTKESPGLRCATRAEDDRWAFIYSAKGRMFRMVMGKLAAGQASAFWYNPRTGAWRVGDSDLSEQRAFEIEIPCGPGSPDRYFIPPDTPAEDNDWVLVLEVAQKTAVASDTAPL